MIETSDMQFDSRMVTAEETPEDHDVEVGFGLDLCNIFLKWKR